MTIEHKKKWLSRALRKDEEINALIEAQEKALNIACSTSKPSDGINVLSSKKNTTEDKFIHYSEYSIKIDKMIDNLYAIKLEILTAINEVDDSKLRTILIEKYINNKTFEEVAEILNYSKEHVIKTLHPLAVSKIEGH